jgi:hypothetical protein
MSIDRPATGALLQRQMFSAPTPVIGMIHVGALPGTPANGASMRESAAPAVAECPIYRVERFMAAHTRRL